MTVTVAATVAAAAAAAAASPAALFGVEASIVVLGRDEVEGRQNDEDYHINNGLHEEHSA